jgi:AraC-like DNA-binding protein/ligand-binding sensor protein
MPRLIRQILFDRIVTLPEVRTFLEDFRRISGFSATLLDPLGRSCARSASSELFCANLQGSVAGCTACLAQQQALLERATKAQCAASCDFGLREVVTPIHVAGELVAFLRFGGYFNSLPDASALNRTRHLAERSGVKLDADALQTLSSTRIVPQELEASYLRWMDMAAQHLSGLLTHHVADGAESLPESVRRACELIRRRCADPLTLPEVAREIGVSRPHLCRLFQQKTGLRFRDYLARARAAKARELLEGTDKPVTDVCFESGFQSVSAFNRSFRAIYGMQPRDVRRRKLPLAA